jgi:hypothetical protein
MHVRSFCRGSREDIDWLPKSRGLHVVTRKLGPAKPEY